MRRDRVYSGEIFDLAKFKIDEQVPILVPYDHGQQCKFEQRMINDIEVRLKKNRWTKNYKPVFWYSITGVENEVREDILIQWVTDNGQ